jgi:hypothetical protein
VVTAAPTAGDERLLHFPRRCCCAIGVKGDYAPPAVAAHAPVLVAPDDSRAGGLGAPRCVRADPAELASKRLPA